MGPQISPWLQLPLWGKSSSFLWLCEKPQLESKKHRAAPSGVVICATQCLGCKYGAASMLQQCLPWMRVPQGKDPGLCFL